MKVENNKKLLGDFNFVGNSLNVFVQETFSDGVFEGADVSALQNLLFREIDRTDGTGERQLIAFAVEKADLGL